MGSVGTSSGSLFVGIFDTIKGVSDDLDSLTSNDFKNKDAYLKTEKKLDNYQERIKIAQDLLNDTDNTTMTDSQRQMKIELQRDIDAIKKNYDNYRNKVNKKLHPKPKSIERE